MQQGNVFNKNKIKDSNRFKGSNLFHTKIFDDSKESFEIDEALKSVNIPQHFFSNYFKSNKDVMYKFFKKQYQLIKSSNYNILEYFELKNVEFKDNLSEKKIIDIIKETFDKEIELNKIYRFKNNDNPAFQLYVNKENDNSYKIIIIDLYHLVIPAVDRFRGSKKAHIEKDYDRIKLYNYCLSNVKK